MNSAVCTLFEGSYHFGLAALTNSLHRAGFAGDMYAGYRGSLPAWARDARPVELPPWSGVSALPLSNDLRVLFVPLETDYHLTNYKPDFMLALLDGPCRDRDSLHYLDPDICVVQPWSYFEQWVSCGVALCEDVNSPLPENHPRRVGWRRYYAQHGWTLRFRGSEYVNGGFVGLTPDRREFLERWRDALQLMSEETGPLGIGLAESHAYKSTGFAGCFDRTDQDALNVVLENWQGPASVVGQEAMAFKPGQAVLPHALGGGKPWQRAYLFTALRGTSPRLADRAFWDNIARPIAPYGRWHALLKRLDLSAAAALGRVFRRA